MEPLHTFFHPRAALSHSQPQRGGRGAGREVAEVDLIPLIVRAAGEGVWAVDVRIVPGAWSQYHSGKSHPYRTDALHVRHAVHHVVYHPIVNPPFYQSDRRTTHTTATKTSTALPTRYPGCQVVEMCHCQAKNQAIWTAVGLPGGAQRCRRLPPAQEQVSLAQLGQLTPVKQPSRGSGGSAEMTGRPQPATHSLSSVVLPKPTGAEMADVVMSASACGGGPRSTVQSSAGVVPVLAGRGEDIEFGGQEWGGPFALPGSISQLTSLVNLELYNAVVLSRVILSRVILSHLVHPRNAVDLPERILESMGAKGAPAWR